MHDWAEQLAPGQRILDVGSGAGSLRAYAVRCAVVSLDEDAGAFSHAAPVAAGDYRVYGKAERMPFGDGSFDLVMCHHVLEHIPDVEATLREIRRVLKPGGRFYAASPHGYGLCDGVYRYVFAGGGHVNRYRRAELVELVERSLGLRLARWQKLYSSFGYLWGLPDLARTPGLARRTARLARLPRWFIRAAQWALYVASRMADRLFGSDVSVYGWALYFEDSPGPAREEPGYLNVCLRCGTGHPAATIARMPRRRFQCGNCFRPNPFFYPFRGAG
jgi:SAM-dependent methyltransferase